ncbi:DUF1822 family protein [Oscillatoria acuminata]|uniref:DUF1822 family protein n=1 Tax=Oscillatoria acuminata PCC 6304 TaxID=56110 RepID=K9TN63_9CYAN|nr:DUF1822 family protein [Oscillatoria acuminata]AFY83828.1 Protein of unknown function (DUF1822) [Oscillatoria acuminata PCC 6304]
MNNIPDSYLSIPLGQDAHRFAREFAAEQATPTKGKQVYLNTLAVYAVHNYLKWLQIESSLNDSNSWNPRMQALAPVADLVIPNLGKVECYPVLPGETVINLTFDMTESRMGYIAVQFEEQLDEAQLLGFFPPVTPDAESIELSLAGIQSLDAFIDSLDPLEVAEFNRPQETGNPVNLLKWRLNDLVEAIEAGWQTIDELFGMRSPAFRSDLANYAKDIEPGPDLPTIQQGKSIVLGTASLALLVKLSQESEEGIDILVRVFPIQESTDLPEQLKLMVLDEQGDILEEVSAGRGNNCIEQPLSGEPGEGFVIKLELGELSATESFII